MCAAYGLGGEGPSSRYDVPEGFAPMDERTSMAEILRWIEVNNGTAKITGKNAHNLNPLIRVGEDGRQLDFAWWWLWVGGKPAQYDAFNSRDDKLTRSWAGPFKHRRALVPATWYIEKKERFRLPNSELFGMAAIYNTVTQEDGTELVTYSLVTRDAVAEARKVNHRMPLILARSFFDDWLDPERTGDALLVDEAKAASEELSHEIVRVQQTLF